MKKLLKLTSFFLLVLICARFSTAYNQEHEDSNDIQNVLLHFSQLSPADQQDVCTKYASRGNITESSMTIHRSHTPEKYLGCFKDKTDRMFKTMHILRFSCTVKTCVELCRDKGFVYAGLQWSEECFCGNRLPSITNYPAVDQEQCQMECSGDSSRKCGGFWAMSVYETGNGVYVIDRDGKQVNRDPLDSIDRYIKLNINIYVEKESEHQQ